jgi:hypothetical protein
MRRTPTVGTVVRGRTWGGRFSGTVVGRKGRSLFVAWHGTCVEDEVDVEDIDVWFDAPSELAQWRGGLGVHDPSGSFEVLPVSRSPG